MESPECCAQFGVGHPGMPEGVRSSPAPLMPTSESVDKCVWTLTCGSGGDADELQKRLLTELGDVATTLVPSTVGLHVTMQDRAAFSSAVVEAGEEARPVDAVVELTMSVGFVRLDEFTAHLRTLAGQVQGWRVKPTLIYDSTEARLLGEPSPSTSILVFVERLDGTTPEHFTRNWYVHAGHLDGQEAESEESLAERKREEALGPRLYRQNRVIEPITPTAWLIHGYTQLQMGFSIPEMPIEPYGRVRGEDAFDRWPSRILQGLEYRVL
jgi:hypothetical protein